MNIIQKSIKLVPRSKLTYIYLNIRYRKYENYVNVILHWWSVNYLATIFLKCWEEAKVNPLGALTMYSLLLTWKRSILLPILACHNRLTYFKAYLKQLHRQIFVIFLRDQWFPVVVWKALGNKRNIAWGSPEKKNCNGVTASVNILCKIHKNQLYKQ
jgi:hypothetical protein